MPAVFLKRPSSPVLAKVSHHAIFSLHPFLLVDPTDVFWCWGFLCCSSAGAGLTDILLSENRKPIRHFPTGLHGHLLAPIWLAPYGVACQARQGRPRWLYELWSPSWTVLSVAAWCTLCCKCFHRSTCVFPRTWRRTCWHFFLEAYKPTGRRLAVISLLQQEHLIKKQFNSMHLTPWNDKPLGTLHNEAFSSGGGAAITYQVFKYSESVNNLEI